MSSPCIGCAFARPAPEHWQPKFSTRCARFAPDDVPRETWWEVKFEIYLAAWRDGTFTYHGKTVRLNAEAVRYGWVQFPDRYNVEHVEHCDHREPK